MLVAGAALGSAVALAFVNPGSGGPALVRGGTPDVAITSSTEVTVDPDRNAVLYVVDATLTNGLPETEMQFYVHDAYLGLLPGAVNLRATGLDGGILEATVSERSDGYVMVHVMLGTNVFPGDQFAFRLTYELPGVGGAAPAFTHADESFASFPVWAHGTPGTPGSRVTVVLPPRFEAAITFAADCPPVGVCVQAGLPPMTRGPAGQQVYEFGAIEDPEAFWAFFSATHEAALREETFHVDVGGEPVDVVLRGWADDQSWLERMRPVLEAGLPQLAEEIGLPYPGGGTLHVDETVSWMIAGYAGVFDASRGTIEVSELADDFVALHEAAHVWFNEDLVAERWIAEGFADYYAAQAASALGIDPSGRHAATLDGAAAFPLSEWPPRRQADDASERYGYAAADRAANLIGQIAGENALARVWRAVVAGDLAYQPQIGAREHAASIAPVDGREFLDQLEELTGAQYDGIWSEWIVPEREYAELRVRANARETYRELRADAGAWSLPPVLRQAMDEWRFDAADDEMRGARDVLALRGFIARETSRLGLRSPGNFREMFEVGSWESARTRAAAELGLLASFASARVAVEGGADVLELVGLVGSNPAAELDRAGAAYAADQLDEAQVLVDHAAVMRADARATGAWRLGGIAFASGMGVVVTVWVRRRGTVPARAVAVSSGPRPTVEDSPPARARARAQRGTAGTGTKPRAKPPTTRPAKPPTTRPAKPPTTRPAKPPPGARPAPSAPSRRPQTRSRRKLGESPS
jgi:hypothetical protein